MKIYNDLLNRKEKIAVIGLGYVGLPIAVEFAKKFSVVGFDINQQKIIDYRNGIDLTNEIGKEGLERSNIHFTSDEQDLKTCKLFIVAVPTPINSDKTPNLEPIINSSKIVAENMDKGSIVVYESTVYPGTTEEICVPILEKYSGMEYSKDFKVGYSPERINPGDKKNKLTNIIKIVSGCDETTLKVLSNVYSSIINAGVHEAESIKVAEAAKVIENAQRDINIAFMNELSIVFDKMGISTKSVLEAAGTKWNFMNFHPGLVGGHCIGVDPYYFTYKAEQLGYHSQIILSGRKINDEMGKHIASNVIKALIKSNQKVRGARIAIMGLTFKENVADVRNTKVIDIINELKDYGIEILVSDPLASKEEVFKEYGVELCELDELRNVNAVIYAVNHDIYQKQASVDFFDGFFNDQNSKVFIDLKNIMDKSIMESNNYFYWSL